MGVILGECKEVMQTYLACMKKRKGMNDPECRELAKGYLTCRMDRWVCQLLKSWQRRGKEWIMGMC